MNTRNGSQLDLFDLLGLAVLNTGWYLVTGAVAAVRWAIVFPVISIPVAGTIAVSILFGCRVGVLVGATCAAGILTWKRRCPQTFDRRVTQPARSRFLGWWRYQRCWTRLLDACHLTITTGTRTFTPKLLATDIGTGTDRVCLRMLHGQAPADYENRVDALAHAFGAEECRCTIAAPAVVELRFRRGDVLAETVIRPRVDHWTKSPRQGV